MSELRNEGVQSTIQATLDTTVLLGDRRSEVAAAAHLRYFSGSWSSWIVAEFVRKRTEWIATRAAREAASVADTVRRLEQSRIRVNELVDDLSSVLVSVDYHAAPSTEDLSWLQDPDDIPVVQTALAAKAEILVTDNSTDFPLGESRNGVLFLNTGQFLDLIYRTYSDAERDVRAFIGQ